MIYIYKPVVKYFCQNWPMRYTYLYYMVYFTNGWEIFTTHFYTYMYGKQVTKNHLQLISSLFEIAPLLQNNIKFKTKL